MKQYIIDLSSSLNQMSEQELKCSIEKMCRYLLFKYGEYYVPWDDDEDEDEEPFDTIKTGEYTICLLGQTIVCKDIHNDYGTLSLIPQSQHSFIALSELAGQDNHIAVCHALIEMVDGLHKWEDETFGEY